MLLLYLLYLPIIYIGFKVVNNSDLLLSTVSIVISIFALFQTKKQINLSNKHQLFEKRKMFFEMFGTLYRLYQENRSCFVGENELHDTTAAMCLTWLTNSASLEEFAVPCSKYIIYWIIFYSEIY